MRRTPAKLGVGALALFLCALPALGGDDPPAKHEDQDATPAKQPPPERLDADPEELDPEVILHTLTPIDSLPTRADLEEAFQGDALVHLTTFAKSDENFGARLRAIRAIPQYCTDQLDACRRSLNEVLDYLDTLIAIDDPNPAHPLHIQPGQKILLQLAAIEALGAARTGHPADLGRVIAFLDDASRDVRVSAARALRDICDSAATPSLQSQQAAEGVQQVKNAISEAIQAISRCSSTQESAQRPPAPESP